MNLYVQGKFSYFRQKKYNPCLVNKKLKIMNPLIASGSGAVMLLLLHL